MKKLILLILLIIYCTINIFASDYIYPYRDGIAKEKYQQRRENVRLKMNKKSAILFFTENFFDCREVKLSGDNLFYMSGYPEEKAILIISGEMLEDLSGIKSDCQIFINKQVDNDILWNGPKMGASEIKNILGISAVMEMNEFFDFIIKNSANIDTLIIPNLLDESEISGEDKDIDLLFEKYPLIKAISDDIPGIKFKLKFNELKKMRAVKDSGEIALLTKAVEITCNSFISVIESVRPGMFEYEAAALMEYGFEREGAVKGYDLIVASGPNACYLHYNSNWRKMDDTDLVLMDCGAQYMGYTADITRTIPVSGKFSKEQRIIYDLALEAQDSAISACIAGKQFMAPHIKANALITEKLKELGIIKEDAEYKKYMPHGLSHYLGLNVHDYGDFGELTPGNIITIEPGIYIPAGSPCDSKWWNISVRIEDDILITEKGPVILSKSLPRKAEEIEQMMSNKIRK
jgi:Xaa-Pro aminopeptidase